MADSQVDVTEAVSSVTHLDAESLTVGAQTVKRERHRIAGGAATELLDVRAVAPLSTDCGAVVRPLVAPVPVQVNATLTTSGSTTFNTRAFPDQLLTLIVNVKNAPTGTSPQLVFSLQELDPGDGTTTFGSSVGTGFITGTGVFTVSIQSMVGNQVKVSWTVLGTTPSFTGVYATLVGKTTPGIVKNSGQTASGDPALVVAVSPNNTVNVTPIASATSNSPSQQTVGTSSGSILASNTSRKKFLITNTGSTTIYLGLGQTPTVTAYHVALAPCGNSANDGSGGTFFDDSWDGAVNAISSLSGGTVCVLEMT